MPVGFNLVAVVSVETYISPHPEIILAIPVDAPDTITRQSIVHSKMIEFAILLLSGTF